TKYRTAEGFLPTPRANAAWGRHNRKPESAKNSATARSRRAQIRPTSGSSTAPVWKATWVMRTPTAANPRIPSSAGRKPLTELFGTGLLLIGDQCALYGPPRTVRPRPIRPHATGKRPRIVPHEAVSVWAHVVFAGRMPGDPCSPAAGGGTR